MIDNKTKISKLKNVLYFQDVTGIVAFLPKSRFKRAKRQNMILENNNPYLKKRAKHINEILEIMTRLKSIEKFKAQSTMIQKKCVRKKLSICLSKRVVKKVRKCTVDCI